ncbi:hypothetical protein J4468_02975 [Candidatus Woesearchaeota archaeon]|nr:hypothetical protein [Candidatus Woesearchaeota archaeon]
MTFYEGLIFDIGDVIIKGTKGIECKLNLNGLSSSWFETIFVHHLNRFFVAQYSEEEFLFTIQYSLNLCEDTSSLKLIFRSYFTEIENMIHLVSNINAFYPVYLFSDHSPAWISYLDKEYYLDKIASSRDFSYERGFLKNSIEAYQHLITKYNISHPSKWLFIDDSKRNCNIAESFGFETIEFKTQTELSNEFQIKGLFK